MATPNPMAGTSSNPAPSVSKKTYVIAGILTTIYGLEELSPKTSSVTCLWLLHPRLQTQSCMEPVASAAIRTWNQRLRQKKDPSQSHGLIAASFDQRNHGTREVDPLANKAWKAGNPRHAQDMFSIYHGTALDTSQLITYLPSYIFLATAHTLTQHFVLGISLGGHAAWHCILHDRRITSAVVVIGCPDYTSLMSNRARLSKLETWTSTSPPGASFLGSCDFPSSLVNAVEAYDPVGLFLGPVSERTAATYGQEVTQSEKERLLPLMRKTLQGKRILNLAGGADRLVPYAQAEPCLGWLKRAIAPGGWFEDGFVLEDLVFGGVGHEMTPGMMKEAIRFIVCSLEEPSPSLDNASKM